MKPTYSEDHKGKHFSHKFPIQDGLKQGDSISPLQFNLALQYAIMKVQEKISLEVNAEKTIYICCCLITRLQGKIIT
jgi:hypothetical protein